MSFILDALRKSEAARRRSEAPDLFAAMPAAAEPLRTRATWPLWLLGAVAALSLVAALWLFAQRAPVASSAAPAERATTEAPPTGTATITTAASVPVPPPQPASTQTPADASPPSAPLPAPTVAAIPAPAAQLPPRDAPAPPPEPVVVAQPPSLPPANDRTTLLGDLDPATRKLLPPLKLSMHLWNETPAQRFVILDGQRLREGDVLGEIVIERITRDGATLAWRGSRLKIELR